MQKDTPKSVWITEQEKGFPEYEVTEQDGTKTRYTYKTLPGSIWDSMSANRCPVYYGPEKEQIYLEEGD